MSTWLAVKQLQSALELRIVCRYRWWVAHWRPRRPVTGTLKGVRPGQKCGSHVVSNVDTKQQNNAFSVLWSWQSKLFRGERVEVVCQNAIVPWHYPQISCLIILFAPCLAGLDSLGDRSGQRSLDGRNPRGWHALALAGMRDSYDGHCWWWGCSWGLIDPIPIGVWTGRGSTIQKIA